MHKWTLTVMTACILLIAGCSTTVVGSATPSSQNGPSTGAAEDITIYQSSGSVAEYCSFLMEFVDSAAELDPDADRPTSCKHSSKNLDSPVNGTRLPSTNVTGSKRLSPALSPGAADCVLND